MYERFTDRARKVMSLAHGEAQRLGSPSVATEHILLGLLKEGRGVAAHVLCGRNVDLNVLSLAVEAESPKPTADREPPPVPPQLPWWRRITALCRAKGRRRLPITNESNAVVESALREARSLHHNYVGTEHLLLGLLHQPETTAARLLRSQGLNLDDVRRETLALLVATS